MKAFYTLLLSLILIAGCSTAPHEPTSPRNPAEAGTAIVPPQHAEPPLEPLIHSSAAQQIALEKQCSAGLNKAPAEIILNYSAYTVSYNPNYRIANWSKHEIYREALERNCADRANGFKSDTRLKKYFALRPITSNDYLKTGYDQGHLTPSEDMRFSQPINDESFYMTNMTPQTPDLNRHAWNALEARVRRWACGVGHLKIYTGPVAAAVSSRFPSCVVIPSQFFKVVLDDTEGAYKAIGFIYSQNDSTDVWQKNAMTVAEVEKRTGLHFFTEFPDDIAQSFKNNIDLKAWENSEKECRACDGKPLRPEQ